MVLRYTLPPKCKALDYDLCHLNMKELRETFGKMQQQLALLMVIVLPAKHLGLTSANAGMLHYLPQ